MSENIEVNVENTVAAEAIAETGNTIVAKRGRGRPKLAETAYDRAVGAMILTGASDTATLLAACTAIGIKKSSAAVYLSTARKNGLVASPAAE
jgi:hypothetical protein